MEGGGVFISICNPINMILNSTTGIRPNTINRGGSLRTGAILVFVWAYKLPVINKSTDKI